MSIHEISIARTAEEVEAASRVRHAVFVEELGALHATARPGGREESDVDAHALHFVARVDGQIVATARVQDETPPLIGPARPLFGLAGEEHYDYTPLREHRIRCVEVARSSVLAPYRRPALIADLWKAVILHAERRGRDHFVTIVQVGYTDSLVDAAIVHARLAQQQLLHPTVRLPARTTAAGPEPPRFPLFTADQRAAPHDAPVPPAFRLFHRFGLRSCGQPVFMPEVGRIGLAMLAGPDTFSATTRQFLARPASWIRVE